MIELKKETERVILVGVCLPGQEDIDASLEELSELAKTAGAVTVGKVVQSRDQVHPGTYVGKGKIDEIKSLYCLHVGKRFLVKSCHARINLCCIAVIVLYTLKH